jgi:hypothetical protein
VRDEALEVVVVLELLLLLSLVVVELEFCLLPSLASFPSFSTSPSSSSATPCCCTRIEGARGEAATLPLDDMGMPKDTWRRCLSCTGKGKVTGEPVTLLPAEEAMLLLGSWISALRTHSNPIRARSSNCVRIMLLLLPTPAVLAELGRAVMG